MANLTDAQSKAPLYYRKATEKISLMVGTIQNDQWASQTPCTDWDVAKLVHHLINSTRNVVSIMSGNGWQDFGDQQTEDPEKALREGCSLAAAAFSEPAAMERTVQTRRGEQLAAEYALGQVQEMLVHGWDLATSLDVSPVMDSELLEVCHLRILGIRDGLRAGGSPAWGAGEIPCSNDADPQTRYLAILGRQSG